MSTNIINSHTQAFENARTTNWAKYENVVTYFKNMYRHSTNPERRQFIERLSRACPHSTTTNVPGNGRCLLNALNATFDDGIVSSENTPTIIEGLKEKFGEEMFQSIIDSGEISLDDLTCKSETNDLSMLWLHGVAAAFGIIICVLFEHNGHYSVHQFKPAFEIEGMQWPTYYLLRHENHFWPLKGEPPRIDQWITPHA